MQSHSRSPQPAASAEESPMPVFLLVTGLSLLCFGTVVARVIRALCNPNEHIDKTVSDPILLDEWDLPRK